jgi:glutamate dehydrogenase
MRAACLARSRASLDEDRILRSFITVIHATLRTNYYQLRDGVRATTSASSSTR